MTLHVWCVLTMQYHVIWPNLELKTQSEQLLGPLLLDIALSVLTLRANKLVSVEGRLTEGEGSVHFTSLYKLV
jgi:hypothetical protein